MKARLPLFSQIIPVFSVLALFVYGWELYRYVWRLPSWLHYLTLGDLLGIFSYAMLAGFAESLFLLGLLLGLYALLPARFLKNNFVIRGTAISLGWFVSLIGFWITYERVSQTIGEYVEIWTLGALALTGLLAWLSMKVGWLGSFLAAFADRTTIFLYLFIPLSLLSLAAVIFRNLF